jgi:putative FmdB family regulatory protein
MMSPIYDYACPSCLAEFETRHSIDSRPTVICPKCQSPKTKKQITACHFVIRESGTVRKLTDQVKRESDARTDLKENYGIEKVNLIGPNNSIQKVHSEVKQQGTFVRDKMQQSAAENAIKTRKKQREWAIDALKRTPTRAKVIKETKAREAMAKRKITI